MLCRAVLTAVAISCTFSREVIGQGSPRKVQIKDLICVLWLSGMQKEDLDVNMLRKLQRHNVNIDDMSRETLKQQCLNFKLEKDNATKEVKDKGDDEENTTTTEYAKVENKTKVKKNFKNDLKMILTDFIDTKTSKAIDDKTMSIKKEVTTKFMIPENDNWQNKNTDILVSILGGDESGKFDLKYDNGQPVVGNILHLGQMFTTTISPYNYIDAKIRKPKVENSNPVQEIQKQKYIKLNNEKSQLKETEYIKKLLTDFINKNTKITTEKPTTASVDLKKLSEQIEMLLKLYPQNLGYSNPFPEGEVEIVDHIQPNGYYFVKNGIPSAASILDERIKQYDERITRNKYNKDNNNRQLPIDYPKKIASLPLRVTVQALDNKRVETMQRFQSPKENKYNFEPTNASSTIITKTSYDVGKKDGENIITQDCIKEIAENVKAIVLNDLRHEITSPPISTSVATTTTFSTTKTIPMTTTTTIPTTTIIPTTTTIQTTTIIPTTKTIQTTTPPNQNTLNTALSLTGVTRGTPPQIKTQEATQVLAKFMELFEQLKSIKDKTEITSKMKNLTNVIHQESKNIFNVKYQEPTVVIDPNKVKKPPENRPGFYTPLVIQSPKIVHSFPTHSANFVPFNPISITSQNFPRTQVKPITIQTNSHEIRPLGIPMSNPLKLIHQNIVVTTTHGSPRDKWVDQYQFKDTIKRKERYEHNPSPPRHAGYKDAAKPLERKPSIDVTFDEFALFKDKPKKPFGANHYDNDRSTEIIHQFKDDTKPIDQRYYKTGRLQELKKSYNDGVTDLDHKSYKYDRQPEFKDDKLIHKIPYKDERFREFEDKLSYQKPYETSRFRDRNHDYSTRAKSPYDDLRNFKLNEDIHGYGARQKHSDHVSYGVLSRNRDSQRFHEKLERVDDWHAASNVNTEDKQSKPEEFASRNQQPLHMGDSRFDDTHFKNFLKTQQKVNDMLEKILSSKSIPSPRSVEIA